MTQLFAYLGSLHPLSTQLQKDLENVLQEGYYTKGSYLLRRHQVCTQVWFLIKGLVRCYYSVKNEEVSAWFITEGNIILAEESFLERNYSMEYIQALEDCDTCYIDHASLLLLYNNYPEMITIGRKIAGEYNRLARQRIKIIELRNAREKYDYLQLHFPHLLNRVQVQHLASFIHMHPETLSKLRSGRY